MKKSTKTFRWLVWAILIPSQPACTASSLSSEVSNSLYLALLTILLFLLMVLLLLYRRQRKLAQLLSREASTDYLTSLINRRHFWRLLESNIALAQRHRQPLAILLLDIDKLKWINDKYGHSAGDKVLQKIAACLKKETRLEDQVGRLGGDEFAVLLPLTKIDTAVFIAERLRTCLEGLDLKDTHFDLQITTSVGVAALEYSMGGDDLYEKADKALYEAKRAGRNRSIVADKRSTNPI